CNHCSVKTWKDEPPGLCCNNGNVSLLSIDQPPEPLLSLMEGDTEKSRHFLSNIRKYNSCFQMTSFGASKELNEPGLKIQGHVYHRIGLLLPVEEELPKFVQIYFMGDEQESIDPRCHLMPGVHLEVIQSLQNMLHEHNNLVRSFKSVLQDPALGNHKVIIRADKTQAGEHKSRFNAPNTDEVATLLVDQDAEKYDIILHQRNDTHPRIPETHRSYDALQYPIIFWKGQDGYFINILSLSSGKKEDQDTCMKRLKMTYVTKYGRPDLFITFTCNHTWQEVQSQKTIHRHELITRVFERKVVSLNNFVTKSKIFGDSRCHMHTCGWSTIHPKDVDRIISAKIPDPYDDKVLFDVIVRNMIHGPCDPLNRNSPCVQDGKCTKYPRKFYKNQDGYPLYERRKPEDGGHESIIMINGHEVFVDNRWVVPYNPLLSKTFKAHINVEYCSSVKSIKHCFTFKFPNTSLGSVDQESNNDEVIKFQIGRYISSNEAVWKISFPISEHHPTVVPLAGHLGNGQHVYFNPETVDQAALLDPKATTLKACFSLCAPKDFVPKYFTWVSGSRTWKPRSQVKASDALGRVYTVHHHNEVCYYVHLLLHTVKGPTSFESLRTFEGRVCSTYREACNPHGLVEDDKHWDEALIEAILTASPYILRDLFCIISSFQPISMKTFCTMQSSGENSRQATLGDKELKQFGLPQPRTGKSGISQEMLRETSYNKEELKECVASNETKLTSDQANVYRKILDAIDHGRLFFLDAPGGTGKTFITNLLLANVRSQGHIALAVASSSTASTLFAGG
uniref:ATP-dependent DNA helicase n=1 Tax=Lepisosteus oculatus TaxID=7918 RepID=W5LX14_LEPOC